MLLTIALTEQQQALVLAHLFVAEVAASLFLCRHRNSRSTFEEFLSSAYLGLCHAAQKFDELRISERSGAKVAFRSYSLTVCNNQLVADMNNNHLIRIPLHHFKPVQKGRKTIRYRDDARRAMSIVNELPFDLRAKS